MSDAEIKIPVAVPVYTGRDKNGGRFATIRIPYKNKIPGVYFIYEDGVLVYIGFSSFNVKKVLYRHFQKCNWKAYGQWVRRSIYNISTDADCLRYTVAAICTGEAEIARLLERQLICKYQPRDNAEKYYGYMLEVEEVKNIYADATTEAKPDLVCPF